MRLVLALGPEYEIPDLEHHLVAPSPRASPGLGGVPPGSSRSTSPQQRGLGAEGTASRSQTPANATAAAAAAAWSQPRLYLLRKGDSPHELDEQSRTSVHVVVTGRLAVARVEAGSEVAAGGGRCGVGGGPGVGKSIFSDYSTSTGEMAAAGGLASPVQGSTPQRGGLGVSGSGSSSIGGSNHSSSPPLHPPPASTPRMTSAALRGEVRWCECGDCM